MENAMATHQQQPLTPGGAREKADEAGQEGEGFAAKVEANRESFGTVPLLIGGEERQTSETFQVFDPARPDGVVGHAASASEGDALDAVAAADGAFRDWSRLSPERRAQHLVDALDALKDGLDERIELLVRENGKVKIEATIEMSVFENRCRLAAELAPEVSRVIHLSPEQGLRLEPTVEGGTERARPPIPYVSEISRMPVGVVTIIVPFNWPLAILAASLPYALVAGNTVIVKPPPTTPIATTLSLMKLASKLPPGVLNVVSGSNEAVRPLLVDERVRKVVFTGSTGAGKRIMEMCSGNLARVTLELGGNDPAILLEDAELDDQAFGRLVTSAFLTTGQVCMAAKRIYVHRSRFDELVEGMSAVLATYRIGHGLDPQTTMGPLNSKAQRDYVQQLRREAEAAGHEVREFGTLSEEAASGNGHFLRPSLVLAPDPSLGVVDQEQFGPILPILPFDDVEPLVDRVNDHWSGLCSSVWSADVERAAEIGRRLRTGTTWINNANAVTQDDRAPFGGFRMSGMGRELGLDGILAFTEAHTLTFAVADQH
jgi:acyl-CoA reductase-like NAD-dependent aldehyde dehydrogenase